MKQITISRELSDMIKVLFCPPYHAASDSGVIYLEFDYTHVDYTPFPALIYEAMHKDSDFFTA